MAISFARTSDPALVSTHQQNIIEAILKSGLRYAKTDDSRGGILGAAGGSGRSGFALGGHRQTGDVYVLTSMVALGNVMDQSQQTAMGGTADSTVFAVEWGGQKYLLFMRPSEGARYEYKVDQVKTLTSMPPKLATQIAGGWKPTAVAAAPRPRRGAIGRQGTDYRDTSDDGPNIYN